MNKPTEIIYVDETIYNEPPPSEASGMKKGEWRELAIMHYRTAYILKSKYDELSLENARLGADLAKVQAELEKVKAENQWISIEDKATPNYDGEYLTTVIEREDCGATYVRVKVIQCLFNNWILKSNQDVLCWKQLPKP